MQPKLQSCIQRCRKNGNHPHDTLARSGYKKNMKHTFFKSKFHIYIYTLKTNYRILVIFTFIFLTFDNGNAPNHLISEICICYFAFGLNCTSKILGSSVQGKAPVQGNVQNKGPRMRQQPTPTPHFVNDPSYVIKFG